MGQAGPQAVAWYSPDGNTWEAPQPLDSSPQLGTERAIATCSAGAAPWSWVPSTSTGPGQPASRLGQHRRFVLGPRHLLTSPPTGSSTTVDGCLSTGGGFLAYGESTGRGQVERPQFGRRATARYGSNSRPRSPGPAGAGRQDRESAPLDGIALGTTTWLGLSGDGDAPSEVWPAPVGGAAGAQFTPAGLWTSDNAGNTWQQLGTLTPAFTGTVYAQTDVAAYVGQEPVVAGTVDGRLAIWVGTPATAIAGG